MRLWRFGSPAFPLWSGEGARLKGGRWNQKGTAAIYAATSFSGGLLEVIAHANIGRVPRGTLFIVIDVPDDAPVARVRADDLPGWESDPPDASRAHGTRWLKANAGLVLLVPNAITSGQDDNALINPAHPDFGRVAVGPETPVRLDPRLFPVRIAAGT